MLRKESPPLDASSGRKWLEAVLALVIVYAVFVLLKNANVLSLSGTMMNAGGLGTIFIVGLVAASSTCLAVVGGLLLSVSAAWARTHAEASKWDKIRPVLLFNGGRLFGYFLLGGIVGHIGSVVALTSRSTGYLTIAVAIVMLILGLNILRLIPKKYCRIPLPQSFQRRIKSLSSSKSIFAPVLLGALTFFLPCGFTQSTQFIALASGSFLSGGLIMLAFALGTLPALIGISLIGSFAKGSFARMFFPLSGAIVIFLGFLNMQSGLLLTGVDIQGFIQRTLSHTSQADAQEQFDPYVSMAPDGRQIVTVYISDQGYSPDSFTIEAGKETWVYAIAKNDVNGCAGSLLAPSFNISAPIRKGANWLGPIKNPQKDFVLTCSMGMLRAGVHVKKS